MPMPPSRPVFECQRCSQCCHGQGGIYYEKHQVAEAAACLDLTPDQFQDRFLEDLGGRFQVICSADGSCALLGPEGCRVHQVKPPICRKWPFFPALLSDPEAFEEAKESCPGLDPAATHDQFLQFYREQEREHG